VQQGWLGRVGSCHLWAMVPNYQAYLVLLGPHQVLPRSMVVRVLATQASDEGTCLPEY